MQSLIFRQAVLNLSPRGVQAVQALITRQVVKLVTPLVCEGSPLLELPAGEYFLECVVVLKQLILTVSTSGGCGCPERHDF